MLLTPRLPPPKRLVAINVGFEASDTDALVVHFDIKRGAKAPSTGCTFARAEMVRTGVGK